MIVKYHGESDALTFVNGKEYEVVGIEGGLYRVIDEEGIDPDEEVQGYLYPPDDFEIVSGSPDGFNDEYEPWE